MEQEQDKFRYVLAIALSMGVLMVWVFFFSAPVQDADQQAEKQKQAQSETPLSTGSDNPLNQSDSEGSSSTSPISEVNKTEPVQKQGVGQGVSSQTASAKNLNDDIPIQEIKLQSDFLAVTLSSKNAVITSSEVTIEDGHVSQDLERFSDPLLQTGRIYFHNPSQRKVAQNDHFQVVRQDASSVTFEKIYQFSEDSQPITLVKKFNISGHRVSLDVNFRNLGANQRIKYYLLNGSSINGFSDQQSFFDIKQLAFNQEGDFDTALSQGFLDMFSEPQTSAQFRNIVDWISIDDRFFARVQRIAPQTKNRLDSIFFFTELVDLNNVPGGREMPVDVTSKWFYQMGGMIIDTDASSVNKFEYLYLPKQRKLLNDLYDSEKAYYFNLFHQFKFMQVLSSMMYWVLMQINLIIGSYGWSILMMTFLLKLSIVPLTQKSMKSMQKMQLLAPKIDAIKKNLKKNPQKMNTEMMALYKREGVNPLGGCLPMLVPLPIFIALYSLFQNMVELQGKSFLWIEDLSLPDVIYTFDSALPFIGDQIHLLPIVMVATSVGQSLSTPQSTSGSKEARQQMMMMKYFMPFFFFFISWSMPSALILYWTTQNLFSIVQTLIAKKSIQQEKTVTTKN